MAEGRALSAVLRDEHQHTWASIIVDDVTLSVSSDALQAPDAAGEMLPVCVSAREQQQIADALGALLPCARILDERHAQSTIQLLPRVAAPHWQRDPAAAIRAHQLHLRDATRGRQGLVSTLGKSWIVHPETRAGRSCNYGWHVAMSDGTWRGIRLYRTTVSGLGVIQPPSWAHSVGHVDYSQTCVLVGGECQRGGRTLLTSDVYREWGLPVRTPGVPPLETLPQLDMRAPLGERALQLCLIEHDSRNPPSASVQADYLREAWRDGAQPFLHADEGWLSSLEFCAGAQSFCADRAARASDKVPHEWRVAVIELVADATEAHAWHTAEEVRSGVYVPAPGDLMTYRRAGGASWWGHVNRVLWVSDDGTEVKTIGANEGQERWRITGPHRLSDMSQLWGVIAYPRDASKPPPPAPTHLLTPGQWAQIGEQMRQHAAAVAEQAKHEYLMAEL